MNTERTLPLRLRCNKDDDRTFCIDDGAGQNLSFPLPEAPLDFRQLIGYLRSHGYYMRSMLLVSSEEDCDMYRGTFEYRQT